MKARSPGQSALLLLDVVESLDRMGIRYMVIGAMAGALHGVIRASVDADVLLFLVSPRKIETIKKELTRTGLITVFLPAGEDDPVRGNLAVKDDFGNQVDLLLGINGVNQDAYRRSKRIEFHGEKIRIVGLEDFVAMKIFAGSPRDIEDAKGALCVAGNKINKELLKRIIEPFGRSARQLYKSIQESMP